MAKIKLFMNVLAVVFYVDTFEVVRKHKNDPWPANRDTFQKGVYSYGNEKIDITECNSTYVDGNVEEDDSSPSSRICRCGFGETFYIDSTNVIPPRPKCMRHFGNEELGCQFKFDVESYVLALNQNGANQNIGTIQYNYNNVKKIQQLNNISVWNMTWQKEQQIPFSIDGPRLTWNTANFSNLLVKYEGLLFKVEMRVHLKSSEVTDFVLLKIEGKRKYPLQTYLAKSSKSDYISSTRKLPRFSTFKVMPTSSIVATRTSSTPIHKSETSSILSKPSLSFKTTPFVKSTQSPSIAVFSSPSTPILQTSAAHSQTIRPLKTTRMSYLTVTPSESLVSFKTQDSSFAIKISSSYESYKIRSSSRIRSSFVAPTSTESTVVLSSSVITNPGGNTGNQNSNNAGMIVGISVGIIVAIAAFVAVVIIYRRRHPSLDEIRRRKGTMTLDLTSNTFSNRGLSFQNPVKNTVGNPMYADKLRFNSVSANGKSDTELYEYAYDNGKQKDEQPGEAIYKEIDEDGKMEPIYREVETEEPIYHETENEYLPIDETKLDSPAKYEALNTATLPKEDSSYLEPVQAPIYQELEEENTGAHKVKAGDMPSDSNPLQTPIYQVLEDENDGKHNNNKDARNDVQSPVYQTLNPEVYEELDKNGAKSPGNVYSKLDLGAQNRPKVEPLYDMLARETGTSNSQYDDDEAEI